MNNDFKIRRDNIDADVRSLHGQVNEMSKAVDNRGSTQALFGAAPEDKGATSAISNFASRIGVVQEVLITQLPPGFGDPFETPTVKNIAQKLDTIKPGLDSDDSAWGRIKNMFMSKDKENTGPTLSR